MTVSASARAAPADSTSPVRPCESLTQLDLSGVADAPVHVDAARETKFRAADVCEVTGFVEPKVKFFVRLPLHGWDGRFLEAGCGGLCGHLPDQYAQTHGCHPFESGRTAVAGTDMGHEGAGAEFGDEPRLRIDFAYRGVHVTALAAKAIVAGFYGKPAEHSYFLGCSDGGREGLMEAERYPGDFDGITAGAAAANFLVQNTFYHAWNVRSNTRPDGRAILTAAELPILHRAALAACHAEDGVIADPLRCTFDPAAADCTAGETKDCLTPAQVAAARRIYAGPHDPGGLALTPGGPQPGSELSWVGVFAPRPGAEDIFGRLLLGGAIAHLAFAPGSTIALGFDDLAFDAATFAKMLPQHKLCDATNPDIAKFVDRGGKLILWHGASDPHISPFNTVAYYDAVKATIGEAKAETSVRFFLIPGLYHCEGGEGPAETDVLTATVDWVEHGHAPAALIVHDDRASRPVFPYPMLAAYSGRGDRSQAASYVPAPPPAPLTVRPWIGARLFTAGSY